MEGYYGSHAYGSNFGSGGSAGGAAPGGSVPLAQRLAGVAKEYEAERAAEKRLLEARLSTLKEQVQTQERQLRAQRSETETLQAKVTALQAEVDKASSAGEAALGGVEAELIRTRFALHARTSEFAALARLVVTILDQAKVHASSLPGVLVPRALVPPGMDSGDGSVPPLSPHLLTSIVSNADALEAESRKFSRTAFLSAAARGDVKAFDRLMKPRLAVVAAAAPPPAGAAPGAAGAKPPAALDADMLGECAVVATQQGHLELLKRLLEMGASPATRAKPEAGAGTLLHIAAEAGAEAVAKHLVSLAAAGNSVKPTNGVSAPQAEFIVHKGLQIDDRDAWGRTPLHVAAARGSGEIIKLLMVNGADTAAEDGNGFTAAAVAAGTAAPPGAGAAPRGRFYAAGELRPNPPQPAATRMLQDENVAFWNVSVRANKLYNDRAFERATAAYTAAIALATAPGRTVSASARDLATLHYNRARARYRLSQHCASVEDCTAALEHDATYRNALAQRAESYMSLFDFERAARDFQALLDTEPSDRQWLRRLVDARAGRDMSHYGVLGVPREADAGAVKRAYRSLCLRWHPDKHSDSPEDVLRANTAFRRINDAWECLSDSYKRMLYDLDPKSHTGTPSFDVHAAAASAGGRASGAEAGSLHDGFDRWLAREREKEAEREAERQNLSRLEAEAAAAAAKAQEAWRAARGSKGGAAASGASSPSSSGGATKPAAPPPSLISKPGAAAPAPTPAPAAAPVPPPPRPASTSVPPPPLPKPAAAPAPAAAPPPPVPQPPRVPTPTAPAPAPAPAPHDQDEEDEEDQAFGAGSGYTANYAHPEAEEDFEIDIEALLRSSLPTPGATNAAGTAGAGGAPAFSWSDPDNLRANERQLHETISAAAKRVAAAAAAAVERSSASRSGGAAAAPAAGPSSGSGGEAGGYPSAFQHTHKYFSSGGGGYYDDEEEEEDDDDDEEEEEDEEDGDFDDDDEDGYDPQVYAERLRQLASQVGLDGLNMGSFGLGPGGVPGASDSYFSRAAVSAGAAATAAAAAGGGGGGDSSAEHTDDEEEESGSEQRKPPPGGDA